MPELESSSTVVPGISGSRAVALTDRGRSASRRRILIACSVVVLPAVLLAGAWRLGGVSALEDDLIYYLPVREYLGRCFKAGEWPFWNPFVGMGRSLAADPQTGLWYPPTWLFIFLPAWLAYPVTVVLHFALAGGGMYRFLRAEHHDWRAAWIGALAFEFSGFLVAHRVHLTMLEAAAWLPWMFAAWRRFADTGRYRHFVAAGVLLGLQLLVQHVQVSIIGGALLTAYVAFVLIPRRRSLLAWYPAGLLAGVLLAGVQWLPTWFVLRTSVRAAPAYHVFVENSWWPSSVVMMLFPMLFGSRTPNVWGQPWWGPSHFCEQFAYGSIAVFVLAVASLRMMRVPTPGSGSRWNRQLLFWWVAIAGAGIIALGRFSPITHLLFEIPVYRSLRSPARWILVVSYALPVLASTVLSALLRDGAVRDAARRAVRWAALRVLPGCALVCVLAMGAVRWKLTWLEEHVRGYRSEQIWAGAGQALRWTNPAILWPLALMIVSVFVLLRFARRPTDSRSVGLVLVMLVDLAGVVCFVDVDVREYRLEDLLTQPPLAAAIERCGPRPGDRLLVPRASADYDRPVEVLWPLTNVRWGVSTANSYGPLEPAAHRLLFRFMPWGSSEDILALLRNPRLCRQMGVRFVAVRSEQERRLLAAAMLPPLAAIQWEKVGPEPGTRQAVRAGGDLLWPVRLDRPGIYELVIEAAPRPSASGRWFVRIEAADGQPLSDTRAIEPVDLALGSRTLRFVFLCERACERAVIRVKAEQGEPVTVGHSVRGLRGRLFGPGTCRATRARAKRVRSPGRSARGCVAL